jgi:predicted protein tyrosine phosphatase
LRSPTAESIFSQWPGVEVKSAGLNNNAATPISVDVIRWAQVILVMEKSHKNKLFKKFRAHLKDKKIVVLGILDEYDYMQPELIQLLKTKVPQYVTL